MIGAGDDVTLSNLARIRQVARTGDTLRAWLNKGQPETERDLLEKEIRSLLWEHDLYILTLNFIIQIK